TKLDRRNFRKKFFTSEWLRDVGEWECDVPHRPGRLYSFNTKSCSKTTSEGFI
ncbi:MAG: NUDIX hydrolase, partial [Sphingobacteriales bacterium]